MLRYCLLLFFSFTVCLFGTEVAWTISQASPMSSADNNRTLNPRQVIRKRTSDLIVEDGESHRIIVKFRDSITARADTSKHELKVMTGVNQLKYITEKFSISYEPLLKFSKNEFQRLEQRAADRSGNAQPDFAGVLVAELPDNGAVAMLAAAKALQALDIVEYVEIDITSKLPPPPGDYYPPTPDLTSYQTFFSPDPGVDGDYAWSVGAKGNGIRFSDCEYKVRINHEDLVDANILEPNPTYIYTWANHGTAAMGITLAQDNGYGMRGLAPEADGSFYTEYNGRNSAVATAIADSSAGDVVLMEMQEYGADGKYVLAEYSLTLWTIVKNGTDAGVIVVAAAGNGNADLDSISYSNYMARGDSGAIIVGAGSPSLVHSKLSFSTYGTRVDVQGWGEDVATLEYGDLAKYHNDIRQSYTTRFSGTSSASAMIAGICVALQSYCLANVGFKLTPLQLRELLIDTGIPQGGIGGHIGPLPNMRAAIDSLDSQYDIMPAWWKFIYFTNDAVVLSHDDTDGDTVDNYSEWIALTDPTNANSFFSVSEVESFNEQPVIHWQGNTTRIYSVWWSSDLNVDFTEIATNLWGDAGGNIYTDTVHTISHPSFYRLDVRLP